MAQMVGASPQTPLPPAMSWEAKPSQQTSCLAAGHGAGQSAPRPQNNTPCTHRHMCKRLLLSHARYLAGNVLEIKG
jgi:hypothetical protein